MCTPAPSFLIPDTPPNEETSVMNSNFQSADSEYIKRLSDLSHSDYPKVDPTADQKYLEAYQIAHQICLDNHKEAHRYFFQHPTEGKFFINRLNELIFNQLVWSGFLPSSFSTKNNKNWDEITDLTPFQHAWDYVFNRVLSLEAFISRMRKYRPDDFDASPWVFFINYIRDYVLRDWARVYREQPHYQLTADEHLESRSDGSISQPENNKEDLFPAIELILATLSAKPKAVFLLWIWPQELPDEWRDKYLFDIVAVATENGLTAEEANKRLEKVMHEMEPESKNETSPNSKNEMELDFESEIGALSERLNRHYELQRLFDRKKQSLLNRITQGFTQDNSQTATQLLESLKRVCYLAVKKNSVENVKTEFPASRDEVSTENPDRKFAVYCYKQKYHRQKWLELVDQFNQAKTEKLMSPDQIAYVLNEEKKNCYVLKSRALSSLGKAFENMLESSSVSQTEKEQQTEEQRQQILADHICGHLEMEKN
ncbi:hypothetical protein [Gimesia sp.]|uniref:hypothetical protein n=1 Tax=Gimesia sp. TaxID=2024833 RepID=UPI003A95B212